jgi:hypothetical protein
MQRSDSEITVNCHGYLTTEELELEAGLRVSLADSDTMPPRIIKPEPLAVRRALASYHRGSKRCAGHMLRALAACATTATVAS